MATSKKAMRVHEVGGGRTSVSSASWRGRALQRWSRDALVAEFEEERDGGVASPTCLGERTLSNVGPPLVGGPFFQ